MIPLIAALLPLLPSIIMGIEHIFGSGNGGLKLDAAHTAIQAIIDAAIKAGKLPADTPLESIPALVEFVVQQLNAAGKLTGNAGAPAVTVPAPQPLPPGETTLGTITFERGVAYNAKLIPVQGA